MLVAGWAEQIFPGLQDAPRAAAGGMQQAQPSSALRDRGEVLPGFLQGLVQSLPLSAPREACPSFSFIPPFQPEREQGEARLIVPPAATCCKEEHLGLLFASFPGNFSMSPGQEESPGAPCVSCAQRCCCRTAMAIAKTSRGKKSRGPAPSAELPALSPACNPQPGRCCRRREIPAQTLPSATRRHRGSAGAGAGSRSLQLPLAGFSLGRVTWKAEFLMKKNTVFFMWGVREDVFLPPCLLPAL